jgi:signal peptidase I
LAALIVAVVIKTFIIQPFYIPTVSMVHTLEVNDRVMVSKLSYQFGEIERGDVVVFETGPHEDLSVPQAAVRAVVEALGISEGPGEDLIKRVIGIGGDTVEIKDNHVLVNGTAIDEPYLNDGTMMPDMPERSIPQDQIWVMGDNRNESSDSRVFGPIAVDDVVGKAIVRIWPLDRVGDL